MIRRNQQQINRLNIITDALLVFVSYMFASWLWLGVVTKNPNMASLANLRNGAGLAALLYAVWTVIVLGALRVYRITRFKKLSQELRNIALGNLIALVSAAALLYLFRLQEFSRGVLGIYYVTVVAAMIAKRLVVRYALRYFRAKGYNLKHNLVVGGGELAKRYARTVAEDKTLGVHLAGIIPPRGDWAQWLERQLHDDGIDEVVLALEPEELGVTIQVIQLCEKSGTKVSVIPFYNDVIPTRANIDNIGSIKLIQLRTTPLDEPFNATLKRAFDIVASALGMIALSPLLLFIAVAIRVSSPGPVLFRQERVGLNKKHFTMYKFRSMRVNDAQETAWTTDNDDRRTWIGTFLRKFSLDELPQLWNVLRGDMSLVGPRPELPHFVEQFRETVPLYMVKHQVKPGITGWAQVNGYRGDTSIARRIELDLWYIDNWSPWLDLKILLMTVPGAMLNNERVGDGVDADVKVVVAAHKPYWMPDDPLYVPLQVGAALNAPIPGFMRDDAGDAISARNANYCELTGLYWAWKNLDCEYLGLAHYRRTSTLTDEL